LVWLMLDIILMAFLGVGGGIVAGLVPGVHPNTISGVMVVFTASLLAVFTPHAVAVFIIAMAISNTFMDFIPSIFIGAPEEDTSMSVLPGHRFLLEGRAQEAICLTVAGGLGVIILSIALFPFISFMLPPLYEGVKSYMGWLLLGLAGFMVLLEDGMKKVFGLFVFLVAGLFGMMALGTPLIPDEQLLFPIFSGMFGISTLIISLRSGAVVPRQVEGPIRIPGRESVMGSIKGFLSGMVMGVLPGIGASQAGVLCQELSGSRSIKEYMVAIGGINTVASLFSLLALYLIARPRSGAAIAVEALLQDFGFTEMLLLMSVSLFSAGISGYLTVKVGRWLGGIFQKIGYKNLSVGVIALLIFLCAVLTGWIGMLYMFTATAIGMLAPLLGTKRTHGMAVLMLPIMLYYFGLG